MSAARFDLATRPRVSARASRASRTLLPSLAALPRRWEAQLAPFGAATIALAGIATGQSEESVVDGAAGTIVLAIVRDAAVGRLAIAAPFAARLVDAALGGSGTFRSARALGPAERGVLAGLLGAAFDPLGWGVTLAKPPAKGDLPPILFRIETSVGSGSVAVDLPQAVLTATGAQTGGQAGGQAGGHDGLRARAGRLAVVGSVELASTTLRAAALVALEPGDALVFDGRRASELPAGEPWPAALALGGRAGGYLAPVRIDARGTITVAGLCQARRQESEMESSGSTDATTVLSDAPVEVVAELGRIGLRGDEILGLLPGAVLTLPAGRGVVSLRVGGELWAEGEIVDVEGELGVRVTRLIAR